MENQNVKMEEKKMDVIGRKSLEEYAKDTELPVTRGELVSILAQILENLDAELMESFGRTVRTANLVEVIFKALEEKKLLSMKDVRKAQKHLVAKMAKEEQKDV